MRILIQKTEARRLRVARHRSLAPDFWSHPPGLNRRPADYESMRTRSKNSHGSMLVVLFSTTWGICCRSNSNLNHPSRIGFWLSFGTACWEPLVLELFHCYHLFQRLLKGCY